MRLFTALFAAALVLASCASSPDANDVEVSVQDPCQTQCTSLYNRCVEDTGGDAAACNADRAECQQECRGDAAEEEGGGGVITNE